MGAGSSPSVNQAHHQGTGLSTLVVAFLESLGEELGARIEKLPGLLSHVWSWNGSPLKTSASSVWSEVVVSVSTSLL